MEERTGFTHVSLIEEIARSASAVAGRIWFSRHSPHGREIAEYLSQSIDASPLSAYEVAMIDVGADVDLAAYVVVFGLFGYAKAKVIETADFLAQRSDMIPLLHAMLIGDPNDVTERLLQTGWLSLLRTLLEQGADPNLEYKGKSARR